MYIKNAFRRTKYLIMAILFLSVSVNEFRRYEQPVQAVEPGEENLWRWDKVKDKDDLKTYFDSVGTTQRVLLVYDQDEDGDWYYVKADYRKYKLDNYYNGMYTGTQDGKLALGADRFTSIGDLHAFYLEYVKDVNEKKTGAAQGFVFYGREDDGSKSDYMLFLRGQGYFKDGEKFTKRTYNRNSHFAKPFPEDAEAGNKILDRGILPDEYNIGTEHSRIEITDRDSDGWMDNTNIFYVSGAHTHEDHFVFLASNVSDAAYVISHDIAAWGSYYGDDYFGVEMANFSYSDEDYEFYLYIGTPMPATFHYFSESDFRGGKLLEDVDRVYYNPLWLQNGQIMEITEGITVMVSSLFINEGLIEVNGGTLIITDNGRLYSNRVWDGSNGSIVCTNGGEIVVTDGGRLYCSNKLKLLSAESDSKRCSLINYGFTAVGVEFEAQNSIINNRGTLATQQLPSQKHDLSTTNWDDAFLKNSLYGMTLSGNYTFTNSLLERAGTFYQGQNKKTLTKSMVKSSTTKKKK